MSTWWIWPWTGTVPDLDPKQTSYKRCCTLSEVRGAMQAMILEDVTMETD